MKPVLYLDIDGVLLTNEQSLAIGALEFIQYAAENFEVYWLTTHCMAGDPAHAIDYLQRGTDVDIRPYLETFLPTTWSVAKTEAIDFSRPFLWFDDDCFTGERITLRQHGVLDSWIEVDLSKHQDQMVHELKLLQSYVEDAAG